MKETRIAQEVIKRDEKRLVKQNKEGKKGHLRHKLSLIPWEVRS